MHDVVVREGLASAQALSILYLRCVERLASRLPAQLRATFNSLFEMPVAYSATLTGTTEKFTGCAFNSLFEMLSRICCICQLCTFLRFQFSI